MRTAVLVIASIESLLIVLAVAKLVVRGIRSDPAGQGLVIAMAVAATLAAMLLLLPAVLLAWHGKLLWLALGLVVVASIAVLALLVAG